MTLEEAAEFLNVSRSTLYRWVREGTVPGHKVGRQWRFLRDELDAALTAEDVGDDDGLRLLARKLIERNQKDDAMNVEENLSQLSVSPSKLATDLVWDAVDHGAQTIHFQPAGAGHKLTYRTSTGLDEVISLPDGALSKLDECWREKSAVVRDDDHRRLFLERETEEGTGRVQVRYQRLETLLGPHVTLRLLREEQTKLTIDDIAQEDDARRFYSLCKKPHGLVLLSGRSGSGKTTTAYVCLSEIAKEESRIVFTIEEMAGYLLSGVNQIEIDLDDAVAYRRTFSAIFEADLDVLFISSTFAQRGRELLWSTAMSAAESGHLVFVQMEADSAMDAKRRFENVVDRAVDEVLLDACWQELYVDEEGKRRARYKFVNP